MLKTRIAALIAAVAFSAVGAMAQQRGLLVYRQATCNPGDQYFAWDQPVGQNLSICVEPGNTWILGNDLGCRSYTITATGGNWVVNGTVQQSIAAAAGQTINIASLPANYSVTTLRTKHTVAFSGAGITALQVAIGSAAVGSVSANFGLNDYLLTAPAANLFYGDILPNGGNAATTAADTMTATFTATGGNLSALTAGTLWFSMCYTTIAQ